MDFRKILGDFCLFIGECRVFLWVTGDGVTPTFYNIYLFTRAREHLE